MFASLFKISFSLQRNVFLVLGGGWFGRGGGASARSPPPPRWTGTSPESTRPRPSVQVCDIRFAENPLNGRSLGCAFVEMGTKEQAFRVATRLHLKKVAGRAILAGFIDAEHALHPVAEDEARYYTAAGSAVRATSSGSLEEFAPQALEVAPEVLLSDIAPNGVRVPHQRPITERPARKEPQEPPRRVYERPPQEFAHVVCFRCGQRGHYADRCLRAKRQQDAPSGEGQGREKLARY